MGAIPSFSVAANDHTEGDYQAVPETAAMATEVESLYDDVFGAERYRKASHSFREGVGKIKDLSWIAVDGKKLVGVIRYWPIVIGQARHPALLLGPLAVARDHAGRGVGTMLMIKTLNLAARSGHSTVLLVGDTYYYRRFGFLPATPYGFVMPGESRPERLQVFALRAQILSRNAGQISRADNAPATILAWPKSPARISAGNGRSTAA